MSGLLPEPAKQAALAAFVLLSTLFALRKYTQPIEVRLLSDVVASWHVVASCCQALQTVTM